MQTRLADFISDTAHGKEADAILRSCVHCGLCTATCPTYQLLGDEDDGPRGRIYLIKSVLEGNAATHRTQLHLDRCLTCRACETTCPSGVNYHRLLDIGRAEVDQQVKRPARQRLMRWLLAHVVSRRRLFAGLVRIGRLTRPLLPAFLKKKVPVVRRATRTAVTQRHARCVVLLEGCVQPSLAPNINAATVRLLDALGLSVDATPAAGCCGALRFHLDAQPGALRDMRANIDAWWPALRDGAEAIVINASGCAPQVKAYGELLADDADYADKARDVSAATLDVAELLSKELPLLLERLQGKESAIAGTRVAFHSPCTLQHGQQIVGVVEQLLSAVGCELLPVADAHLCCGSAGTYSLLQPALAAQLRDNKIAALTAHQPDVIATANIGCYSHMSPAAGVPVRHWIELLDQALHGSTEPRNAQAG